MRDGAGGVYWDRPHRAQAFRNQQSMTTLPESASIPEPRNCPEPSHARRRHGDPLARISHNT